MKRERSVSRSWNMVVGGEGEVEVGDGEGGSKSGSEARERP